MALWSQDKCIKALRYAAEAHNGQLFPGTDLPYLLHISLVSMEVMSAISNDQNKVDGDAAVQCAILHDVIEDAGKSYDEIKAHFGKDVADGMDALSKRKSFKTKAESMADSLSRIKGQPREVWMVKMADRISNLLPPPPDWSEDKISHYKAEAIQIYNALKDGSEYLAKRLREKIDNYPGTLSRQMFERYIGIDYSGAETPTSSLKGLRIYLANRVSGAHEVMPPPSPRKYWTRREIAEWLAERLSEESPALVGIDHGFSFPLRYFEVHHLPPEWPGFLDDFQRHWPTDDENTYVDFVRDGVCGNGAERSGSARWRRITEERAGAKSVFHFDVPGSVAKATHAGLPWLRFLRKQLGSRVHFWPFDGWDIPAGRSIIAEVYPALWSKGFARKDRTADQHDAYCAAEWMRCAELDGTLRGYFNPSLTPAERAIAQVEGWILGIK